MVFARKSWLAGLLVAGGIFLTGCDGPSPPVEFDDVSGRDLSGFDFSERAELLSTLTFDERTVWPAGIPEDWEPERLLQEGMNPGLGIRRLHGEGITGAGVNVAIIDQSLDFRNHPEYAGKVIAYHDESGEDGNTMHGPAVLSLLAGEQCGTAPGVKVYYAAKPFSLPDSAYAARCLEWVIEQNRLLPEGEKIRVVSISSAPSGPTSPYKKNLAQWDEACDLAEAEGILVLDCTSHRGFVFACYTDADDREAVASYEPGYPGIDWERFDAISSEPERYVLAPSSWRTIAQEPGEGETHYRYCGRGGQSWAVPYCAGVLALGWQVRPDLDARQMKALLIRSCHVHESGSRIVDPVAFIRLVKEADALPE